MSEYTVDLVIYGDDDLSEEEISQLLGLKADIFLKKGEPLAPQGPKVRSRSSWSLNVRPPESGHNWDSLEAGLVSLLEKAEALKHSLRALNGRYSVEAYCGYFGAGFAGPSISAKTLGRLANLGLGLTIKVYFESTERDS